MGMLLKHAEMGGLCVLDGRSLCRELLEEMETVMSQRTIQVSRADSGIDSERVTVCFPVRDLLRAQIYTRKEKASMGTGA